jgi:hypothetical protein
LPMCDQFHHTDAGSVTIYFQQPSKYHFVR